MNYREVTHVVRLSVQDYRTLSATVNSMAHVNIIIVKLLIRSGHFSEKRFLTLYFFYIQRLNHVKIQLQINYETDLYKVGSIIHVC